MNYLEDGNRKKGAFSLAFVGGAKEDGVKLRPAKLASTSQTFYASKRTY